MLIDGVLLVNVELKELVMSDAFEIFVPFYKSDSLYR
jgi:hypothetical protein